MTCVIVTAIGGDVAQGVARILREARPDWTLIGTDISDQHGGTGSVDRFVKAPRAGDGYPEWLAGLASEFAADFCVPMNESELSALVGQAEDRIAGARLVWAGRQAIGVGADKLRTVEFLGEIGLPAPWATLEPAEIAPRDYPCIYKPRAGAGSRSVFVCRDAEDAAYLARRHPNGLFQELLLPDDAEITCAVFRSRAGSTVILQLLRRLAGGATAWARVIDDPQVDRQCRAIAEALDLRGAINVQLRLTPDGPRVFEINARFSSTALMRHRMGFCDVVWTFQDLMDEAPEFALPAAGTEAARTQDAFVLQPNPNPKGE